MQILRLAETTRAAQRIEIVGLLGGVIVAAVLRLKGLTTQSLWLDELYSVWISQPQASFSELVARNSSNFHPLLYQLMLWDWFKLLGYSDLSAKLLSALLGILCVPALYFLGRRLFGHQVGLVSAWLLAVNYFSIYYSQEVRAYALLLLLTCVAHLCFWRMMVDRSRRSAICYGISAAALLHSHNFGLFIIASHLVAVALWSREAGSTRSWRLGFGLCAVLYTPWLPFLWAQIRNRASWQQVPEPWFFGDYFVQYFGAGYLAVAMAGLIVFGLARVFFPRSAESEGKAIQRRRACYVLALSVLTVYGTAYLVSILGQPILHPRYTIITLPAFLVLAGLGLIEVRESIRIPFLSIFLIALSLVWLLGQSRYYTSIHKQQWREAIQYMAARVRPNDLIVSEYPALTAYYLHQAGLDRFQNLRPASVKVLRRFLSRAGSDRGIWLFTAHQADGLLIPEEVQNLLRRRFEVIDKCRFYDARVLYLHPRPGRKPG